MSRRPQLIAADVRKGLVSAGFFKVRTEGSHEHWEGEFRGKRRLVTVDEHLDPFSDILVGSMSKQAGMSRNEFYEVCSKPGQKKAKRGLLDWLLP